MVDLRVHSIAAPLRKQVVETIRKAITDGVWLPGDRLGERELCEQTGVSRTLIREALRQLEAEGLIESVPNRGLFISKISEKEAADLYAIRATLEAFAGRIVARSGSEEVKHKLRRELDDLNFATSREDLQGGMRAKSEFYQILFTATNNTLLCEILQNLHARTALLRATTLSAPGRTKTSVKEIAKIVRAIEKGDGDAAATACADHVEAAAAIALRIIREEKDLESAQ